MAVFLWKLGIIFLWVVGIILFWAAVYKAAVWFNRWTDRNTEIVLKPDSRRNLQKAILRSGFGRGKK